MTGEKAKYFDPLTKQPYSNMEAFKIIRERYFQKEEESLLLRIQTLSDLASLKKEKLRKYIATNPSNKNLSEVINKIGIIKNESTGYKKPISNRVYSRSKESCWECGTLLDINPLILVASKKIFKDKTSFTSKIDKDILINLINQQNIKGNIPLTKLLAINVSNNTTAIIPKVQEN